MAYSNRGVMRWFLLRLLSTVKMDELWLPWVGTGLLVSQSENSVIFVPLKTPRVTISSPFPCHFAPGSKNNSNLFLGSTFKASVSDLKPPVSLHFGQH